MDTRFCIEALEEALARHGKPRIFNTDQGAQFTSSAFTAVLEAAGVADFHGTGVAGSWTTSSSSGYDTGSNTNEVHLKVYADGREARFGIGLSMSFSPPSPSPGDRH